MEHYSADEFIEDCCRDVPGREIKKLCLGSFDQYYPHLDGDECFTDDDLYNSIRKRILFELSEGLDIDHPVEDNRPNVFWSISFGSRLFKFLLHHGSNLNKTLEIDSSNKTIAKMILTDYRSLVAKKECLLKMLITYGAHFLPSDIPDIDLSDLYGANLESVDLLKDYVSSINKQTSAENFVTCCEKGYGYMVDKYLTECSSINITSILNGSYPRGRNCLQIAMTTLPEKFLLKMIDLGADIYHRDHTGKCFYEQIHDVINDPFDKSIANMNIGHTGSSKDALDNSYYYQRLLDKINRINTIKEMRNDRSTLFCRLSLDLDYEFIKYL